MVALNRRGGGRSRLCSGHGAGGLLAALVLVAARGALAAEPAPFELQSPADGAWCTAACAFRWQGPWYGDLRYQLFVDGALKKDGIGPNFVSEYALAAGEALSPGFHSWHVVAKDGAGSMRQSTSTERRIIATFLPPGSSPAGGRSTTCRPS